ncbi:glucuronate isomerase [Teredinibacter haidensis]|uniref:glucuronate isomerase n=1 Tax=Teredinibacter haidensis TaxID=2731755 RepID=UPI000948FAE4|nr:glucuronate isomerase [Teredinibacter haidensis]
MKPFMGEDFLLSTETARTLYHQYAAPQPIIDYHCHLPSVEIAENRQFTNMAQVWLEGDHYKWRALRAAGVEESLITGGASDYDKYMAWANTVPQCIGNPLYTWTHLELQRPFGLYDLQFGPTSAESVWQQCNELLASPAFSARGIMQQMNVKMVGTTDDPIDSLEHHAALADTHFDIKVLPSFRPDRAYKIELEGFVDYLQRLGEVCNLEITRFEHLIDALDQRLNHFAAHGCNLADHGIEIVRFADIPDEVTLDTILARRLNKQSLSELEIAQFSSAIQVWLGRQYARRNWVMQLHMGAQRDNNTRLYNRLGPNTGFDSIGDHPLAQPLAGLLNAMDLHNELPKTILYCINPSDNEVLGTMIGNFQDGSIAGKVQFGSGWWFNDQKDGMLRQLMQLSQLGLLSKFVGMLTDSRSFLSYTRHEYFRRILCELLGNWVENGELPNDINLMGGIVEDICFNNANRYFQLNL